jgi:type II secretory pathway predicted ATPase ExeA
MALSLLPSDHMRPAFEEPSSSAPAELMNLLLYIENTGMKNSTWPPESVSVFRQQMRTNNDVEGRHRRAKQEAHQHGDLNLYLLIELLHDEATHANHQLRLMSEGRLRR